MGRDPGLTHADQLISSSFVPDLREIDERKRRAESVSMMSPFSVVSVKEDICLEAFVQQTADPRGRVPLFV